MFLYIIISRDIFINIYERIMFNVLLISFIWLYYHYPSPNLLLTPNNPKNIPIPRF